LTRDLHQQRAGTAHLFFSSQGAVFSLSDLSELEQTSSAKFAVWWGGSGAHRPHLEQLHRDTATGALPRGFRAGQSRRR